MRNLRMGKMLAGKGIVMETTCGQGGTIADKVASGAAGREHHRKPVFFNLHCGIRTDTLEARTKGCPSHLYFSPVFFFFIFLQFMFQN